MMSFEGGQAKDELLEYLLRLKELDKTMAGRNNFYIPFSSFTLGDGLMNGKGNYGGFTGDMTVDKAYGLGALPGKGMYSGDKTVSSAYGLNKSIDGILGYNRGISQSGLYGMNNSGYMSGYKGISLGGYGKGGSTGGKSGDYSSSSSSSSSSGSGSSGGK